MKGRLLVALLGSILLHGLVLTAPGWHVGDLLADNEATPINAVLLPAPAKPRMQESAEPVQPKVIKRKPRAVGPPADNPALTPSPEVLASESQPSTLAESATQGEPVMPEALSAATPDIAATEAVSMPVAEAPEVVTPLPRSGRIEYAVMRGIDGLVVGRSTQVWQHDGKRYNISATIRTTGIAALFKTVNMVQTSEGSFRQGELKPDSFRFDRGENKIETASFDWQENKVTLGNGQVAAIGDGAEDLLSMFYQLMNAAQKGEGFIMAVATGRKVERYAFEWLPEEDLSLKAGNFRAWHVRVRAADGGKDVTEVWLAQNAAGLPVKIRFTDRKGDVAEQVAEAIDYERQQP